MELMDLEEMQEIQASRARWAALVLKYRRILKAGGFDEYEIATRVRDFRHRYRDQFLGADGWGKG